MSFPRSNLRKAGLQCVSMPHVTVSRAMWPCGKKSHHISSHACSIIGKGQGSTPGSARRSRITLKSGKRRRCLEQMSRPRSTSNPVSLAVGFVRGIFTKRPCCGNLLPMQFSHHTPTLDEPNLCLYQCCTYSCRCPSFIHPVVQYGCQQICQPFFVTPKLEVCMIGFLLSRICSWNLE